MKRVYVSTVGRGKQLEESSRVYCLDWDQQKVVASARIPMSRIDLSNPRGGVRGARGMTFLDGKLIVAGYDSLSIFTDGLKLETTYWFDELVDIHQIYEYGGNVLVMSTGNDRSYRVCGLGDGHPGHSNLSLHNDFRKKYPIGVEVEGSEDTLHANSCDGCIDSWVLLNRIGAIAHKYSGVVIKPEPRPAHDLFSLNSGEIAYNASDSLSTIAIHPMRPGEHRVLLQMDKRPDLDTDIAKYGYTRGMCYQRITDQMLVGSAPATIHMIENCSDAAEKTGEMQIADDIAEATFDVLMHPDDWGHTRGKTQ